VAFGPVAAQHDDGVSDRDGAGCQLEPAQDVGHPDGEQDDGDQSRGDVADALDRQVRIGFPAIVPGGNPV
jgi:hypothetical protein